MPDWTPTLGATGTEAGTAFRVWAPERAPVDLVTYGRDGAPAIRPMARDDDGYWCGRFADVRPGDRYRYRLDGRDDLTFPDPAARYQPEGVHGPSAVVDPASYEWRDRTWTAPRVEDLTIYELHVGTFSAEGTFRGVVERLPYLADLGVSAIELMPVADFPGARNWGYDGVAIFAPARCYGSPDDLRALVDAAHAHGLATILDVVYNHLGPDGAYAHAFSPYYFTDRHRTAWGAAVNLDGPHSEHVRRFFIENALHWVREYHFDVLRLDATHALHDDESPTHFLAELTTAIRERAGRPVIITAEDHRNLARMLQPAGAGGFGIDAVWADDFHHQVRVHTAGDRESYYADYTGSAEDLATTVRQGWFFTGQHSTHLKRPRGTSPAGLAPCRFVYCIQNHDQIGNRADGARLHHQVDAATYRAASALLLLAPQIPLIFMGQEWATTAPFQFFTDHHEELGRLVTAGRRREFAAFAAFGEDVRTAVPDPQDVATFERSRLRWDEAAREPHASALRLYRRLLALRRELPLRDTTSTTFDAQPLDAHSILLSFRPPAVQGGVVRVAVRLSGSGRVLLPHVSTRVDVLLTTEDEPFADGPRPIAVSRAPEELGAGAGWTIAFSRPGAIVLRESAA
jgi:maltooligosyltrehalose trehalohydrolase